MQLGEKDAFPFLSSNAVRSTELVELSTRATSVVRSAESQVEDYECRVCRVATSFLKLSIQPLLRDFMKMD